MQLLQQPVPPEDWSAADIGGARRRVAALTEGHRLDMEMAAIAAEVLQREGSFQEAGVPSADAAPCASPRNGVVNGSSPAALSGEAALRAGEPVLERGAASNSRCSEEGQREVLETKAGALAVLQYQRGLLSRYGLLTKVAQAKGPPKRVLESSESDESSPWGVT